MIQLSFGHLRQAKKKHSCLEALSRTDKNFNTESLVAIDEVKAIILNEKSWQMRTKIYSSAVLALAMGIASVTTGANANTATSREYQIKAAFLYNFIKFTEWPKEKMPDAVKLMTIGVIGNAQVEIAFRPILGKAQDANGNLIAVKYFKSFEELKKSGKDSQEDLQKGIEALRTCHLLFISNSEKKNTTQILEVVKDSYVLTVGEVPEFLEVGGMINFVLENEKMRFEINAAAAAKARLKIRSQLLRLAKRVIEEEAAAKDKPTPSEKAKD